ncbi:MAG TPA: hypothetical protein VFZ17_06785 [Acidimicrobiia bacterium]|nr:hypothetical protein [Acidimicrobiia bacterium]
MRRAARWIGLGAVAVVMLAACDPPPPEPEPPAPAAPAPAPGPGDATWAQNGPLGTCHVFPADNAWNRDVSTLPVSANSTNYVNTVLASSSNKNLHADFGGGGEYGIPYITVSGAQPLTPITFVDYGDESDPGPYPIPLDAPIEGGSDSHVLAVDRDHCMLYELFAASPGDGAWNASSGAVFDLTSNALRPDGWTSADAAGLPIFAGLVRYDEVASGHIDHALRFTVAQTQRGYVDPATHFASSSTDPNRPPMGLRFRLKASFDTSQFAGQSRVILEALKKYGMIVADNGSNWFITGAQDARWNDDDLNQLKTVPGAAFEVVDTGPIHH